MQINTEKWGQESEWQVDTNLSTSSWQDTDLLFYLGKYSALRDYRTNSVFDYNTPIDYTIAYSAHAADTKMPLADIGIYNYQGTKKYSLESNNGWFLAEQNTESNTDWESYHLLSAFESGLPENLYELGGAYRWAPDAVNYSDYYPRPSNPNRLLRPIVKFSPKSFFGVVYCEIIKNDYSTVSTISLKELKDNIATYQNDYFIAKSYMRMYAYNGRVSQDGNYNNYVLKSLNNLGVGTTTPIPSGNKELTTYYPTVGTTNHTFPIAGTLAYNRSYSGHCGVQVKPQTTDSGGGSEWLQGVTMAHLVDSTHVDYFYSNVYGYIYVLQVKIPITTEVIDELYKGAAAYGFFFSDAVNGLNADTTNVARWLNENMYCGVLDENGVGHGEFTKGFGNAANPVFLWDSNQDSPYDPSRPPSPVDPNTYSNITSFNSLSSGASMVERYVLNDSNVRQLLSDLWTITDDLTLDAGNVDFSELSEKILDEFLVTNPIDCIISLQRYPFNIPHTFSTNKVSLKLGKSQVTSQGYPTHNIFNTVIFSGVDIYPKFGGSFLDYAPYTEYELYIPFCGTIKLNAGDIIGHTLNCRLQIDLITGVCTAYILADQLVIETVTGNCACEMQITGTDTSYMAGSITGAITQAKSTKLANITTSWSPLSIGGAISTVSNPWKQGQTAISARYEREKAEYDLQHIQTPVHTMGSASPLTAWYQEFTARLIIYYPEGDAIDSSGGVSKTSPMLADLTDYAHTTGFACVMNGQVSQYHGLTVGNIDTSSIVGASEEERNMIKALFSQGVWLP